MSGLRCDGDVRRRDPRRLRDRLPTLAQPVDVEGDRLAHLALALLQRRGSRDAAGEIGRVRREVDVIAALDHDQIAPLGHRSYSEIRACLTTLAQVFGCSVSDGLPAIVTSPGRFGCLYCPWLPRVRASSSRRPRHAGSPPDLDGHAWTVGS